MTFPNQLFSRDVMQGSTVFRYKVEHFPHWGVIAAVALSGNRRAFLLPKSREGLGNNFFRSSKMT